MSQAKIGLSRVAPVTIAGNPESPLAVPAARFAYRTLDVSKPVVLLGGRENTLAVTRNLGRLGIPVHVSGRAGCLAMHSRHCRRAFPVRRYTAASQTWHRLLIGSPIPDLLGSIVIAMCDESLEFLAEYCDELGKGYKLKSFDPELCMAMLDKHETLVMARAAGVPTPNFWSVETPDDVLAIRDELRFPVIVKPLNSRAFMAEFGSKLFIVRDSFEEVLEKVALSRAHGQKVIVLEMIPGPDSLLSSFNTYRTASGERLYDYTKSIVRRWPVNRGGATYHRSHWLPETAEMGRRLFDGIGWQGIGNVEFKRDMRDGQLKIIEVNGRFTAAQRLITEAGAPIDLILYCHLTGQPLPRFETYSQTMRFWYPLSDFLAFLQMHRAGELSLVEWLRDLASNHLLLPVASWRDPMPSLAQAWSVLRKVFGAPGKYLGKIRAVDS